MRIVVELSKAEIETAEWIAEKRMASAIAQGMMPATGMVRSIGKERMGAYGECAAARHFNLFWGAFFGDPSRPDVGGFIDVKSVDRDDKRLIFQPQNNPDLVYLLAWVHRLPVIHLVGWQWGYEIKRLGKWEEHRPNGGSLFLPNDRLNTDVDAIFRIIRGKGK